jgi:hypothetical protein
MYGRGKLDLLQARVIDARSSNRQRSASEPTFDAEFTAFVRDGHLWVGK